MTGGAGGSTVGGIAAGTEVCLLGDAAVDGVTTVEGSGEPVSLTGSILMSDWPAMEGESGVAGVT